MRAIEEIDAKIAELEAKAEKLYRERRYGTPWSDRLPKEYSAYALVVGQLSMLMWARGDSNGRN